MSRVLDAGEMRSLAHVVSEVFPRTISGRANVKQVLEYVRHVRDAFDVALHPPPISRDPWHKTEYLAGSVCEGCGMPFGAFSVGPINPNLTHPNI